MKSNKIMFFLKEYNKEIDSLCGLLTLFTAVVSVSFFIYKENKIRQYSNDSYAYNKVIEMYADKNNAKSISSVQSDLANISHANYNKPDVAMYLALRNNIKLRRKTVDNSVAHHSNFNKVRIENDEYSNIINNIVVEKSTDKNSTDSSVTIKLSSNAVSRLYDKKELKITCYKVFNNILNNVGDLEKRYKISYPRIYIQDDNDTILAVSNSVGGFKYIGLG